MAKEPQWTRDANDPERLPVEVQTLFHDAIEKLAGIYGIDLKSKPKRKVLLVERMALLVIAMPQELIKAFVDTE